MVLQSAIATVKEMVESNTPSKNAWPPTIYFITDKTPRHPHIYTGSSTTLLQVLAFLSHTQFDALYFKHDFLVSKLPHAIVGAVVTVGWELAVGDPVGEYVNI